MKLIVALVTFKALMTVGLCAQSLACVQSLVIPHYTPFAVNAGASGRANVTVNLDHKGLVRSIDIDGVDDILRALVRRAVEGSRFSTMCRGQVMRFSFVFELVNRDSTGGPRETTFEPPNTFFIRARSPEVQPSKS
jgi:hypothetical protein